MTKRQPREVALPNSIALEILQAVDEDRGITQRKLANRLGIALGLTNLYLQRCVRKGLIKIQRAPARRYAYYLTPVGFTEKSRLTARFLARSFRFYRVARNQLDEAFAACAKRGLTRIALAGAGELAEISLLCAFQNEIEIVGVIDKTRPTGSFRHVRMVAGLAELGRVDAVIVTDLVAPQATFDAIAAEFAPDRIIAPSLLKITRDGAAGGAAK